MTKKNTFNSLNYRATVLYWSLKRNVVSPVLVKKTPPSLLLLLTTPASQFHSVHKTMSCSPSSCLPLNDLVNFHRSSSAPAAPPCATPPKLPPTDVERPTNVVHSQHQALLSGLIWHEGEIKSSVFGIFQLGRVTCLMSCWESQAPTGRAAECGHVHCTMSITFLYFKVFFVVLCSVKYSYTA